MDGYTTCGIVARVSLSVAGDRQAATKDFIEGWV